MQRVQGWKHKVWISLIFFECWRLYGIRKESHQFKTNSSWLNTFIELKHLSSPEALAPVELARRWYKRPSVEEVQEAMKTHISFIVGRNPLERLVSCYREKIAVQGSLLHELGTRIMLKYRNGLPADDERPTFPEFTRHVVEEHANSDRMDMHWEPVYRFCSPCQFNFTYIIKMETFSRDQKHVMEKSGIIHRVAQRQDNVGPGGPTSPEMTTAHLKSLPKEIFDKLVKIYEIDFVLFGYRVPKFDDLKVN